MSPRGRAAAAALVASVVLAACAQSGQSERAEPDDVASGGDAAVTATTTTTTTTATGAASNVDRSVRRELGLALRADAEVPTNALPPVEVHDVGQDRMVNFKNIFPTDRPVLLWMWAPY